MADAAIGATIQVALETVLSLASDRIGLLLGFKEELDRLCKTATKIRGFLADAEDKKHSPEVLDWLKDLEGEVFKAENLLDEVNYENLRREVKFQGQPKRKVCFFFPFFSTLRFRSRMAFVLRDINTNLERINRQAERFGLVGRFHLEVAFPVSAPSVATTSRQTDSVVVPNVVGRANDESKIVEMLLSPSNKVVSVIPIVGMGGLGKTTLAKSVYNHLEIEEHFEKKIWVCVAEKIGITELFKIFLESLTTEKIDLDRRGPIVQKIRQELEGKRFFLVLDDVWNDEQGLWNDFFMTLEGLKVTNGSWCLATTRLEQVANTMSKHLNKDGDPYYKLQNLTDDDCWSIIKEKVIGEGEVPQELEAIKEQILRRCDGLPLAATLIGGLLLNKRKEEWRFIMEESLLEDDVKHIIKVSFDNLSPISVKNCVVYCSLFPQDAKLDKNLLIELWMAEGYLQLDPKNERLMMEDIGNDYFRILLQSSLLEEVEEWGTTSYKMHDLVHDFAKSALNEDRYLALNSSQGMADIINGKTALLCTLFLESRISGDDLSKFKCLHVLKLSGKDIKVLPASVSELIHLRILDISNSAIIILPESLCKLYNLQTLRIENYSLRGLPRQMSNLISLRHLHYYDLRAKFQMPSEMGRLTCLQTLKFFNVGQEDGRGIEELGSLKYLKGSLQIRNLGLVNGKKGAEGAKLFEKPNLSKLIFLWSIWDRESNNRDKNVLEGLQPHPKLQELEIKNFMGDQLPGWFINLTTLVELKFIDCKRCNELPALGQLPSLESLVLRGLENIRSIGLSFYGISSDGGQVRKFFPALKYLTLKNMKNLAEWKDTDEVRSTTDAAKVDLFPVLKNLCIENCSQLTSAPSPFPSIELLGISDNCHILLLKKIVSSCTTISSIKVSGYSLNDSELTRFLTLRKQHHSNNLELSLKCCGGLPSETLERLCHLRHLELKDFSNLTKLACSTSPESLILWNCENLKELPQNLDKFQALRDLSISRCPKVNELGGGGGQKSFVFASLENLKISFCHGLISVPGEMSCASLQTLEVHNCPNLVSFPLDLQQTPSLKTLCLTYCPKLTIADIPKGFVYLTSLRELRIGPFSENEITAFDWSGLISSSSSTLRNLTIYGRPHMESLPEQLQCLTSLKYLHLEGLGIEALPDWIGNLMSLERLSLQGCEKLLHLPSEATMGRLTILSHLVVQRCPLLKKRCNPQSGPEWPKISHISFPDIS